VLLLVRSTAVGCAAKKAFNEGEKRMRRQDYDQAVLEYSRAVALKPANSRYSVSLSRAKLRSAGVHFEKGRRFSQPTVKAPKPAQAPSDRLYLWLLVSMNNRQTYLTTLIRVSQNKFEDSIQISKRLHSISCVRLFV
jgi:hypothetical protein